MSLSVDGVWKVGVWATTVWADGVWREGAFVEPAATGGGIGHGGKKKKVYKTSHRLWVVRVDDKEYEVDDLVDVLPKVIKKKGKVKIQAKPLTDDPRTAAEIYANQLALTAYVPMPSYDNRLNLMDVTDYLMAMMELEEEEELLLLAA